MNMQLRSKAKDTSVRKAALLVFALIVLGLALVYVSGDTEVNNNSSHNRTGLNLSKYYDTEKKVCQNPDIDHTNKSQLKACVSNQTTS